MANRSTVNLIQKIIDEIKQNGQGAITGPLLQTLLIDLVQSRGLIERFVSTKAYSQYEFVSYNNIIYMTIQATIAGETPDTHPVKFQIQGSSSGISAQQVTYAHVTFTNVKEALDDHDSRLDALTPAAPEGLSGKDIIMALYAALESGTGANHECTDLVQPAGQVADFYDADNGTLSCEIDTVASGSRALTSGDDSGTYSSLQILNESDPYQGVMGEGIYKVMTAQVLPDSPLAVGLHSFRMIHSITGISNLKNFYVDDPANATVQAIVVNLPASSGRYVSGVPSLQASDVINLDFDVADAVGKHYHPTQMAIVTGNEISSLVVAPPATPPSEGATVSFINRVLTILANRYSENITLLITPQNSKGVAGTPSSQPTNARLDLISDESARKIAGTGQFPASGYGGVFVSNQSLKTSYTEELQMLNGEYRVPTGNYSSNQPTPGEDYSSGMGSNYRYCIPIDPVSLTDASGFTINILNATGFTGEETPDVRIQVKVQGATGWLDANAAFNLVGSPAADGDPCMLFADSDGDTKRVSFGETVRSGLLYVRIGLPAGSTKRFQGVSITNIV